MISPYKRIIVYDLETGGLNSKHNRITELAMVAVDLQTLEVVDEFSILLKPRLDLTSRQVEVSKEAKDIFMMLNSKDEESKLNVLMYKGKQITLKNLEPLIEDIEKFYQYLAMKGDIIEYEDYLKLEASTGLGDIAKIYFDKCYNPIALEMTGIPRELLVSEGVSYKEAFESIETFVKNHTIGNSKPIRAGHNIKKFDDPYLERVFEDFGKDMNKFFSDTQTIDTLEWARLRWFELASFSLGVCANEVGLTLKGAHRALPDTVANAQFLIKLLKGLRGEGAQSSTYQRKKFNYNF